MLYRDNVHTTQTHQNTRDKQRTTAINQTTGKHNVRAQTTEAPNIKAETRKSKREHDTHSVCWHPLFVNVSNRRKSRRGDSRGCRRRFGSQCNFFTIALKTRDSAACTSASRKPQRTSGFPTREDQPELSHPSDRTLPRQSNKYSRETVFSTPLQRESVFSMWVT